MIPWYCSFIIHLYHAILILLLCLCHLYFIFVALWLTWNSPFCRHSIQLLLDREPLLKGKHIFPVHNFLDRCRKQKEKGIIFLSFLLWAKCMWPICGMGWGIISDWFVVCRLGPVICIVYVSTACPLPSAHEYYYITIRNSQHWLSFFLLKNVKWI